MDHYLLLIFFCFSLTGWPSKLPSCDTMASYIDEYCRSREENLGVLETASGNSCHLTLFHVLPQIDVGLPLLNERRDQPDNRKKWNQRKYRESG
ncbi:uncharacterized protein GJ701_004078 isoform 1-T1 [Geothlypis trichas]